MPALQRISFTPTEVEQIVAFCVANGATYDASLVQRLLLDLTSDPVGVFVLADAGAPVLVASVIDRAENGVGAAHLELLAVAASVSAAQFAALVVAPAVAFARAGVRRSLHVRLSASFARIEDAEASLLAAGFEPSYESFVMVRPAGAGTPAGDAPLPAGWRWSALDEVRAEAVHALLTEAFQDAPSFSLSPLPVFRRSLASGTMTCRVLWDGETAAGFVNVVPHDGYGEIRTVARSPAYAGRGLGPRMVAEGLRLLLANGARDVELDVEARNDRALALYRRFGFEIASRIPVLAFDLGRR